MRKWMERRPVVRKLSASRHEAYSGCICKLSFGTSNPQQLVSVEAKDRTRDLGGTLLRYELVRDRNQSFQSVAAWTNDTFNLTRYG